MKIRCRVGDHDMDDGLRIRLNVVIVLLVAILVELFLIATELNTL
jgi:hypothetical protein